MQGEGLTRPDPEEVEGEEEYEVEEILKSRMNRGKLEYLVKWKGYSNADNTWEPRGNLKNAEEVVEAFHRKYPSAPRPAPPGLKFRQIFQITAPLAAKRYLFPWESQDDSTSECGHSP